MIQLNPMSPQTFEDFKKVSQSGYATDLASVEEIPIGEALAYASEQFQKLVPNGLTTADQSFFEVIESGSSRSIGFLWLGFQTRFGRKVASINDIHISPEERGKGFGRTLIKLVEKEAKKAGAHLVRLHVFHHNQVAQKLYLSMGFSSTSIDMRKKL